MSQKQINELVEKRDYAVLKENATFLLKAILFWIAFILSVVWIWVLDTYYVAPKLGTTRTDFGVMYGMFIVAILVVCFEAIHERSNARDYNVRNICLYYNHKINYAEACRIAYDQVYHVSMVDFDEVESEESSVALDNATDYIDSDEMFHDECPYDFELTDEELRIEVLK